MGMRLKKWSRSSGLWLAVIIVVQTVIYVLAGMGKAYIHMDEAYSLALAQYDKVEIQENEDFYNHWHTKEYFQDYLAVQEDERGDFRPVYENQKNDVHPPLYYLLLRMAMEVAATRMNLIEANVGEAGVKVEASGGEFSKWPGIILNILFAAVNTVLLFKIIMLLIGGNGEGEGKNERRKMGWGLGLTLVAALTNAAIGSVVYIRMYELLTLFVLLTAWLNLMVVQKKGRVSGWIWLAIGMTALAGVLTQYYYLFFLVPMWVCMTVWFSKRKEWRRWGIYTGALGMAGVISLIIWPYSIQHMFFGYRGQGVMASLLDVPGWLGRIWQYILVLDYDEFHRMLALFVVAIIAGLIVFWWKKRKEDTEARQEEGRTERKILFWSVLSYFLIVAAVSPFIELRYIMPICSLAMVMVVMGVWLAWQKAGWSPRMREIGIGSMLAVMLVASPVQIGLGAMRIELLYRDKEALMSELEENAEVPALYMITTENNRFLDNILPFATLNESYLALDVEPKKEVVEEIMRGKDLSRGLYLFVSDKMDTEEVLRAVMEATGFMEVRWVRGVNTCEIYYLR